MKNTKGRPTEGEGRERVSISTFKEDREKMAFLMFRLNKSRSEIIRDLVNKEFNKYMKKG